MKNSKWGMLVLLMAFFVSCSSTPIDPSKPEMSVQENEPRPPKTFNQLHKEWDY
ncbi:MAG: hypothetical protein ACXVLQ_09440 [Bacteriovorax sp.]